MAGRPSAPTQISNNVLMIRVLPSISPAPAMSQWAKVQENTTICQQMQQYYPLHFPMEVRYFLCQWIEEQSWVSIDENNVQHAPLAEQLLTKLLELLHQKIKTLIDKDLFLIKIKMEETYQRIENMLQTKPLEMVHTIKDCLAKELMLIEQSEEAVSPNQPNHNLQLGDQRINEKITSAIQSLVHRTKSTESDLRNLQHKQESFIIQFSDGQRITAQRQQLAQHQQTPEIIQKENQLKTQKEQLEVQLATLAHELLILRIALSKKYEETIMSLQELQREILDNKLISWKRRQQLAGNGLAMTNADLSTLQHWCEDLADLIWQNRQQIKKSAQLQQQLPIKNSEVPEDLLPKLNEIITSLLSSLVTSTFVVEQQPPQVLKKDAKFSAAVCLLVGGKLSVHMNPPQVKATIISEQQANNLFKPKNDVKAQDCSSGEILNNSGTMEYQSSTGHLGINFRNMQLKKIKRADKRGSEAVTEEKFCILFQSEFTVGGSELVFQVWTVSWPVVVTVHGNQECNATATVLWDNAFAEPGRAPFVVPDQVEWNLLADQLSLKFLYHTGKGLSTSNLAYMASKLFGDKDPSTCKVSWTQFNKETLCNRSFTFWEWVYGILKLNKDYLKDLWADNAIVGFVSKNQAQNMLIGQPHGTFLLRFSDSEIGGITIAWTGEKEVLNLAPFTGKDFNIRALPNRISDLSDLVTLYPNKPKDLVFSKYYTSTSENVTNDGYICHTLNTTIPEKFKSSSDTEIKQPFSQESIYDTNLNSVHNMDEISFVPLPLMCDELTDMDITQLTDYMPEDIDELNDITIEQLSASHQFSG